MFKLSPKTYNDPVKQSYIVEEDLELEDEDDDVVQSDTFMLAQFLSSTGPEEFSNHSNNSSNSSNIKKFKKASRILSRLRKQPTMTALGSRPVTEEPKKHIPLQVNYISPLDLTDSTISSMSAMSSSVVSESTVVPRALAPKEAKTGLSKSSPPPASPSSNINDSSNYNTTTTNHHQYHENHDRNTNRNSFYSHHNSYYNNNKNYNSHNNMHQAESVVSSTMRDSGIYSETMSTLEKPTCMMINDMSFPHPPPSRPEPLPPAVAFAAIDAACQPYNFLTAKQLRTVPEAALKRRSVRLRHIQIQTETIQEQGDSCPHCRQVISPLSKRQRRPSCPPALSSGPTQDKKQLYDMIHSLKLQLDQERKHRQELEKRVDPRHLNDKKEALLKEKSKWEGDCLWMNNRMALISE